MHDAISQILLRQEFRFRRFLDDIRRKDVLLHLDASLQKFQVFNFLEKTSRRRLPRPISRSHWTRWTFRDHDRDAEQRINGKHLLLVFRIPLRIPFSPWTVRQLKHFAQLQGLFSTDIVKIVWPRCPLYRAVASVRPDCRERRVVEGPPQV